MHSFTFFWLMVIASIVAMLGRFIKIPYTIALVLTGLLVGYFELLPGTRLEPHILFALFLPPLLFEAGIHIHFRPLKKYWKTIAVLAILGTGISTAIIGYGMHLLLGLPFLTALLFGAMISPTDPISVLSLFKKLGVNERLSMIVEAESLFNDGIAVVLFGVIQGVIITGAFSLSQSILSFAVTVVGGAIIGILVGAVASRITQEFDDHLLEITLTTIVAYGSYLAAESFHVSGVIAVVVASLVVGNYGIPQGMSPSSRLSVFSFWEYAAFAVNSMVFLLVGLEISTAFLAEHMLLIGAAIAMVLAARALSMYSLSALLSSLGEFLPASWRHVLVWGGLRGALSMAMVLGVSTSGPEQDLLIPLVFGVVLFSLLGQGLTVEPLVARLGLSQKNQDTTDYHLLLGEHLSLQAAIREVNHNCQQGAISQITRDQMIEKLTVRQTNIEKSIAQLHLSDESIAASEQQKAERIVTMAQQTALKDAARSGMLEWSVAATLIRRNEESCDTEDTPHTKSATPPSSNQ